MQPVKPAEGPVALVGRLLSDRWHSADATRPAFEGPFGDEKKVVMDEPDAAARLAGLGHLASGFDGPSGLRIGVLSNHRIETYLAVLASVSAGATFVPLNPKFPVDRLRSIVELSRPNVVLGDRTTAAIHEQIAPSTPFVDVATVEPSGGAVAEWASRVAGVDVDSSSVAYIMFTSGSTGTPKGVPISYGNLVSYVDAVTDLLGIAEGSRFSQFFDLSFDLSMHDIFVSTRLRGTLVAPGQVDLMMPAAYVTRESIDAWFSVPLLGAQLGGSKKKEGYTGLRSMLFCGEALPMETVIACRPWLAGGGRMWNLYGPTEATIAFTAADVTDSPRNEGNASIGNPFGRNRTAMLDAAGVVVTSPTIGDEGELLLGGSQVFAGYSTDAPSPFIEHDGVVYYRSGDLVRIDAEGVYFRGRVDSQVKFRGYRIELGEIETVARRIFGLKTLAVVVDGEGAGARLVLFHLASELADSTPLDLRALESTLPPYMVPALAAGLEQMPVNQNGKIDRRALAVVARDI